jgi:colanic acid biosynthesis glycosyl transferase WcaI
MARSCGQTKLIYLPIPFICREVAKNNDRSNQKNRPHHRRNRPGWQGLDILADAARLLVDDHRLFFVFCGNGAGRPDLEALCKDLPNVRFLDLQPLERLGELLTTADIHLLPQRADAADLVMPSKLTGMLASGRPVVVTAHPGTEVARVVEGRGMVVPPEQADVFADAIASLADDAEQRARYGVAARRYAEENLDKEAVLRRFEAELLKLSGKVVSKPVFCEA